MTYFSTMHQQIADYAPKINFLMWQIKIGL